MSHWNSMEFSGIPPFRFYCRSNCFLVILVIQGGVVNSVLKDYYSSVGLLRRRLRSCCHIGIQWNSMEFHLSHMLVKRCVLVIQVGFKFETLTSYYSVVGLLRRRLRSCCHIGIQWNSMGFHLSESTIEPVVSWSF